ncbi:hypothetical protein FS749_013681 [Ceratobasidium sp. UAMH 11750]|nr:hypothetical protein FS749_013681 [Ceratobasidium sp. UAMH 11750]
MHLCSGKDVFLTVVTGDGKSILIQGPIVADLAAGINSIGLALTPTKCLGEDQVRLEYLKQNNNLTFRGIRLDPRTRNSASRGQRHLPNDALPQSNLEATENFALLTPDFFNQLHWQCCSLGDDRIGGPLELCVGRSSAMERSPSHLHDDPYASLSSGYPSLFPSTTSLTVGPGFTKALAPGYPTNPDAFILESTYKSRELVEISFDDKAELLLGRFRAIDYFGDGSFYLVDSPRHAIGHICGLARTTPDTFVFMGGDICHHAGQLRPTQYLPLPEYISPNPFRPRGPPCPGSILLGAHPRCTATEPFYRVATGGYYHDPEESQRSLAKLEELDGHPNIFTIIAHDQTLLDIIDFYPKTVNDWRSKGYKERAMWQFVRDFREAVKLD